MITQEELLPKAKTNCFDQEHFAKMGVDLIFSLCKSDFAVNDRAYKSISSAKKVLTKTETQSMSTKIHPQNHVRKGMSPASLMIVSLLTICTIVSSVNAQTVIFQDDFSRVPVSPSQGSALAGSSPITGASYASGTFGTVFDFTTAPTGGLAYYTMQQLGGENVLFMGSGGDFGTPGETYGQTLFSSALTGQGAVTMSFNFVYYNSNSSSSVGNINIRSFSNSDGSGDLGLDLRLDRAGTLSANSGSGYEVLSGGTYGADIATNLSLTADFDNQTFSVTLSNALVTKTYNYSLSGATGWGSLAISGSTAASGGNQPFFYMDNLLITSTAPIPEPNSLILMLGAAGIFALVIRRKVRSSVVLQ